ncbi:hypothetical protein U8326_13310 [Tsuneonella sp. CC-YZS046]|uniref:hypothetical protein n=1 Tax=Tsuneonella sp. CC-YZS046 TaxID=3042152 RepID=UPI002D7902D9|nr:hypothetical protein [Tsuneonella sp. CC-YZS046]WRO66010.1 hypothetical protein U8326_13310 [Tsuneonella sp. CC-YZS046]
MRRKINLSLCLLPLLAACGGSGGQAPVKSVSAQPAPARGVPATKPAPPPAPSWRAARVMEAPGLEGVIGADVSSLTRQFGQARLDVWEGDARKLQFSGQACVLDIYLYPPAPKSEPKAAYVDARRASDGQDVDRAACVAALKK